MQCLLFSDVLGQIAHGMQSFYRWALSALWWKDAYILQFALCTVTCLCHGWQRIADLGRRAFVVEVLGRVQLMKQMYLISRLDWDIESSYFSMCLQLMQSNWRGELYFDLNDSLLGSFHFCSCQCRGFGCRTFEAIWGSRPWFSLLLMCCSCWSTSADRCW